MREFVLFRCPQCGEHQHYPYDPSNFSQRHKNTCKACKAVFEFDIQSTVKTNNFELKTHKIKQYKPYCKNCGAIMKIYYNDEQLNKRMSKICSSCGLKTFYKVTSQAKILV